MARVPNMELTLRCDGDKQRYGVADYSISPVDLKVATDIAKGDIALWYVGSWKDVVLPIDRVFLTPANARILATAMIEMADDIDRRLGK